MHITFILPAVGHRKGRKSYPKTWIMEPLSIAMLSALTPENWTRSFFDDRLEEIDYAEKTDLVCISAETYTAKRSYQIATRFRAEGKKVLIGGFHASLVTEEVRQHADSVFVGEGETLWHEMLSDVQNGTMKPLYCPTAPVQPAGLFADRSIFGTRDYGLLSLVETSRGCRFSCEFCSITAFFRQQYYARPLDDVVREIASLKKQFVFFVDDNLAMDVDRMKNLCRRLVPLRKRWVAQLSIHAARDVELLRLMKESGCIGVLIGFESLNPEVLKEMGKTVNETADMREAVENLRHFGLSIYATFVFGYDLDTEATFEETLRFAIESKFFFAAFNHLVPFPGTPLYERLLREKRLLRTAWWLEESFTFGDVVFQPRNFTAGDLAARCLEYRKRFYSPGSILRRGNDYKANCSGVTKALLYYLSNLGQRVEVDRRRGLPFGDLP